MPFYSYNCETCNKTFKSFHSTEENETKCIICSSTNIKKVIPTVRVATVEQTKQTAGNRVERFIEESREALKQQVEESRKDYK